MALNDHFEDVTYFSEYKQKNSLHRLIYHARTYARFHNDLPQTSGNKLANFNIEMYGRGQPLGQRRLLLFVQ